MYLRCRNAADTARRNLDALYSRRFTGAEWRTTKALADRADRLLVRVLRRVPRAH
jgi:hypothetical protein